MLNTLHPLSDKQAQEETELQDSCDKERISGTFMIVHEQRSFLSYNLDTQGKRERSKTTAVIRLWNYVDGNNWLLTVTAKHKHRAGETRGPPCSEAAQSMFRQTSIRNCQTCYYRLPETGTPVS